MSRGPAAVGRLARRLVATGLALACLMTVLALAQPAEPDVAPAADLTTFRAGNIISDAVFYDSDAMTAGQIQIFLDAKGAKCRQAADGTPCLKDYDMATSSYAADDYCQKPYQGSARESAATIIEKVADACGISPRVLLVMLQKETSQVTRETPTAHLFNRAMGYGCPDNANGTCSAYYPGLHKQLYFAARQFQRYAALSYTYEPGRVNAILFSYRAGCTSKGVFIENEATASLYNYTPYQPNQASLAAGYGTGDGCSEYGNRNFFHYFVDWFGGTQTVDRDAGAPVGDLEVIADKGESLLLRGWALDPDDADAPLGVNVYVDGVLAGRLTTGVTRPDVPQKYPGAGPAQGFDGRVPASVGAHTVCAYPVNILAGSTSPRLGCGTITVTPRSAWNPVGAVDGVRTVGTRVSWGGWSFDPDAPKFPATVRLYAGSLKLADVTADRFRSSVGDAYPSAGSDHGFSWTGYLKAGTHRLCAYALNKGSGTANPRLGCRTVVVDNAYPDGGSPKGRLDTVTVTGDQLQVRGWTFDPDVPKEAATVRIIAGTERLGDVVARGSWPDVGTYYPAAGSRHGFDWTGTLRPGTHRVCVFTLNKGFGSTHPPLGCRTVTVAGVKATTEVPGGSPVGSVDPVELSGDGTVTIQGWTFDPDVPTRPATVRIYDGGQWLADVRAGDLSPQVDRDHPYAGNEHGFRWSGALDAGTHEICVYTLDVGVGTTRPGLGCQTVVVGSATPTPTTAAPTTATPTTAAPTTATPTTAAPTTATPTTAASSTATPTTATPTTG